MSNTNNQRDFRVKGPPSLALGSTNPAVRKVGTGAHSMAMYIKNRKITATAARSLPQPHSEYLRVIDQAEDKWSTLYAAAVGRRDRQRARDGGR